MSPEDLAPPPTPPVVAPAGSNPYVLSLPSSGPPAKSTKENLMEMFIRRDIFPEVTVATPLSNPSFGA
ncbi:hypothetical protein ZWY2020_037600 [Hordeum vulgare]|nr:hypothetical protein ZWY2020_037600 [Hordeum vulgare]